MRKYIIPFIVVTVLTAYGWLHITRKTITSTATLADEYLIYTAVIHYMFAGNKVTFDTQAHVKLLVISDQTANDNFSVYTKDEIWRYLLANFPSASQETIVNYIEKNKEKHRLNNSFDLKMKYVLVERQEIERQIFSESTNGWEEFYKKYTGSAGYVGLSRVGFNYKTNQALVYMEHMCGGLCGSGHYLLLIKDKYGWKVVLQYRRWIS